MTNESLHNSTPSPSSNEPAPAPSPASAPEKSLIPDPDTSRTLDRAQTPAPHIEFDRELCALVADTAPAMFAVCEVEGIGTDEVNGWVVAWGLAQEGGRTHIVTTDGPPRLVALASPERALWWFGRQSDAQVRLVWLDRSAGATFDAARAMAQSAA